MVFSNAVVEMAANANNKPRKKRKAKKQSEDNGSLPSNLVEGECGADGGNNTTLAATEVTSDILSVCETGPSFDFGRARSLDMVCLVNSPVSAEQQPSAHIFSLFD